MAPKYKLYYFEITGRGETARMMFHYAGVPFEDIRIKFGEWKEMKPTTPYGVLPILEIDGKKLCQTNTINRYLAKQFGLCGNNDWESAQCDEIGDFISEMFCVLQKILMNAKTEEAKKEAKDLLDNEYIKKLMAKMAQRLKDNGTGWLVSDNITWIDMEIAERIDFARGFCPGSLDKYPELLEFAAKVNTHPKLKNYIDNRPPPPAPEGPPP